VEEIIAVRIAFVIQNNQHQKTYFWMKWIIIVLKHYMTSIETSRDDINVWHMSLEY